MKVVLDTNVVASGIFWSGPPLDIVQAFFHERINVFVTEEIFEEYSRVITLLANKYKQDMSKVLDAIKIKAHWNIPIILNAPVCEDPDDDKFIACAISSDAKIIVSGDKLLLRCSGYRGINIMTPKLFVATVIDSFK